MSSELYNIPGGRATQSLMVLSGCRGKEHHDAHTIKDSYVVVQKSGCVSTHNTKRAC